MYSMALGPRFPKWKMLSLSGPKALLFLQLLVALLTRSVVNVCAISNDFLFVSLVTNRVSPEEVCLPSFGSSGEVGSLLRRSSRLVITSNISAGTGSSWSLCRPVGMWCDAALSRTVRKIFSSLWQSVGRERLLRAVSTSCLYLSQLAFFRLT